MTSDHGPGAGRTVWTPRIGRLRLWLLLTCVAVLVASGALWLWAEHVYAPVDGEALQPWDIKHGAVVGHAAFALVFVFLAGTLLQTHMQLAWRQGRNRATGVAMTATLLALTLSGFALWYAGDEDLRRVGELMHWVTGFGLPLLLAAHAWTGRRRR